jgi:hypothetical protein
MVTVEETDDTNSGRVKNGPVCFMVKAEELEID